MKKYILSAGFVFISALAMAQGSKIVAEKSGKGAVVTHEVQPKEGLYALARLYNVPVGDLAAANKLDKNAGLNVGQKLKIPVKSLEQTRFGTGAPVYYVVDTKENLNAISSRFNKMPVKNIMIWNDLKEGENVKKGQEIIVGYLPKGVGSPEQATAKQEQPGESKKSSKNQQAVITGTNINIRKGPSTDQDVVGTAQQNDVVDIIKKVNSEWTSIRTKDGVEGFVASQFVQADAKKAEPKKEVALKTAVISGTNINIRKGPSTDQEVVGIAQQDEIVSIVKSVNKEWTSIRTKDGTEGYVAAQFLQEGDSKATVKKAEAKTKQAKVYGTNINVRKGPSTDQDVVGIAQQDEVLVFVKKVNDEWSQIRMGDGTEGFIATRFLSLDGQPALAAVEAEKLAQTQAEEAKRMADEAASNEKAIAAANKKAEDLVTEKISAKNTDEAVAANTTIDESGYFKKDYEKAVNPNFTSEKTFASGIFKTDRGWNDGKYYVLMDDVAPGTLVKITNPSNSKIVYAKVLGKMKGVQYSDGFDVRISEAAAKKLQAENTEKFNVAVTY